LEKAKRCIRRWIVRSFNHSAPDCRRSWCWRLSHLEEKKKV